MILRLHLVLALFAFTSCASYVNKFHREFDRSSARRKSYERDKFDQYRKKKKSDFNNRMTSIQNPYVVPSVKRNYQPSKQNKKRYSVNDIADSNGDGSLWSGVEGRNNFLFTNNEQKRNGDIVLIQVADKLKKQMTSELKHAFPSNPALDAKAAQKSKDAKAPASVAAAPAAAAPAGGEQEGGSQKIHDRISGVVIEEVNKDHLLIRGRKTVLYKNRKRLVEVQALVAQRDVKGDDTIHSDDIIESNINIIR